jgi:hypothetical protein
MIQTKREEFTVVSTLEGDSVGMTIDAEAVDHLMAVLTELYTDQELACIREYSTNAWDAQVEAGVTTPIEVTLPNALAPTLQITDHGTGMNADDINDIYSKYGKSTKTESNDYNGVLGLGCKSALAYTNQFTVTGIKDGVRTVVSVSRDEEGVGSMTILLEEPTEAPNGVTVEIVGQNYNEFADKAANFFQYWPEGRVLVNGEAPKRVEGLDLGNGMLLVKERGDNVLLMGGVAYPIDSDEVVGRYTDPLFGLSHEYRIVCEVPNGSVHFAPSREGLRYTPRTKEVLKQLAETYKQNLTSAINAEIDKAETAPEAFRAACLWTPVFYRTSTTDLEFKWRGEEIPHSIPVVGKVTEAPEQKDYYGKRKGVGRSSTIAAVDWVRAADAHWIHNHNIGFTANHKKKLWQYYEENGLEVPKWFILCGDLPDSQWIDKSKAIDWEPVSKVKLPRNVSSNKGYKYKEIKGSYEAIVNGTHIPELIAAKIDTSKPIFWTENADSAYNVMDRLKDIIGDHTVVVVPYNRQGKFKKLFPQAQVATAAVREYFETWWEFLTEGEQRMVIGPPNSVTRLLNRLPKTGIEDPVVRRQQKLAAFEVPDWLVEQRRIFRHYLPGRNEDQTLVLHVAAKYPLVIDCRATGGTIKSHFRTYMNAIYQESNA